MAKYDHQALEAKWRKIWEEKGMYQTPEDVTKENKKYVLPQLPYPSGSGLHVGHANVYSACDIYARYLRMTGKKVLEVIGWDAFGLPAENYAIRTNIHPRINTDKAIDTFREQIKSLGISVDWSREVGSHNPDYYKWTQWFFLLMYKRGLAYRKKQAVNWCETDKTVLANEQVVNGKCERCGTEVVQREMEQWFLKITDYADRLTDDLDKVDWPAESVKRQRDWIGRSEGALIQFTINNGQLTINEKVEVFTTRADTIFGATFLVLSPEHRVVQKLLGVVENAEEIRKYVMSATHKSELERQQEKEKTGVKLEGIVAINPVSGEQIPIFIADYVLSTYGTGSIMGVPAHDDRDSEFARKFNLPFRRVIINPNAPIKSYLMGADEITDVELKAVGAKVVGKADGGSRKLEIDPQKLDLYKQLVQEKLTVGYWNEVVGEQVWFMFKESSGEIKEYILSPGNEAEISSLAVKFTKDESFATRSSLVWLSENDFYKDVIATTELGVLVNSGEYTGLSSGEAGTKIIGLLAEKGLGKAHKTYKLRDWSVSRQRFWGAPVPMVYDPEGNVHPVREDDLPVILPDDVDFVPTGRSPLTYSPSFQGKVEEIYGKGWKREVDTLDTFMCSSWYYYRYLDPHNDKEFASSEALKTWMPVDFYLGGVEHVNGHLLYSRFFTKVLFDAGFIDFDEPFLVNRHQGTILGPDGRKMGKRWGNVINPTDVVYQHGGDTVRIYEMFMGPLEQDKVWNPEAATGVRKFLQRIFDFNSLLTGKGLENGNYSKFVNIGIKKVGEDLFALKFNTAVAELMKMLNEFEEQKEKTRLAEWEAYLKMLAPFAPFLTDELWQQLGHSGSIHLESFPQYGAIDVGAELLTVVVQVNSKIRDTLGVRPGIPEDELAQLAKSSSKVAKYLDGVEVKKQVYIPGKLINFVTG